MDNRATVFYSFVSTHCKLYSKKRKKGDQMDTPVLPERHGCLGALDITIFSLCIPGVGLPPSFMLKMWTWALARCSHSPLILHLHFEDVFIVATAVTPEGLESRLVNEILTAHETLKIKVNLNDPDRMGCLYCFFFCFSGALLIGLLQLLAGSIQLLHKGQGPDLRQCWWLWIGSFGPAASPFPIWIVTSDALDRSATLILCGMCL